MIHRRALIALAASAFALLTMGQESCDTTTTTTPDESGSTGAKKTEPRRAPARVGSPITLKGQTEGTQLKVTVLDVIDPAVGGEFDEVTAGKRRVGIKIRMENTGSTTFTDSPSNGAVLLTAADEQGESTIVSGGVCSGNFATSVTIGPGSRQQGCLPFEVPKGAKLKTFQMKLDSGFGPQAGEWTLR